MGRRNQVTLLSHPTPTNDNILIQADVKDEPDLQCEFSCEPAAGRWLIDVVIAPGRIRERSLNSIVLFY